MIRMKLKNITPRLGMFFTYRRLLIAAAVSLSPAAFNLSFLYYTLPLFCLTYTMLKRQWFNMSMAAIWLVLAIAHPMFLVVGTIAASWFLAVGSKPSPTGIYSDQPTYIPPPDSLRERLLDRGSSGNYPGTPSWNSRHHEE